MAIVEIVTLVVALVALALAGTNSYYQFFRKIEDLKVSILDLRLLTDEVCVDLVFSNTGDRAGTIFRVSLTFPVHDSENYTAYPWSRLGDEDRPESLTVAPGELIHRKVYFPFSSSKIDDVIHEGPTDTNAFREVDAELRFIFDARL